jgi:hypothetical protein
MLMAPPSQVSNIDVSNIIQNMHLGVEGQEDRMDLGSRRLKIHPILLPLNTKMHILNNIRDIDIRDLRRARNLCRGARS